MKITILGTSGGAPLPERAQSGILIQTSETTILLDCGMAVPLRLAEAGINPEDIDVIFISHKHLDHIQDIPTLVKASRLRTSKAEYDIVCPPSMRNYLQRFLEACEEYDKADIEFTTINAGKILEIENLNIEAFSTKHTENSLGFKVSQDNIDVVYTSDTAISQDIKNIADGANLLIHEVTFLEGREDHTGIEDMIKLLKDINVRDVIITHFDSEVDRKIEKVVKKIEKESGLSITAGYDLQEIII